MSNTIDPESVDLHKILSKSLYFGLFSNVLGPASLLLICHYLNDQSHQPNRVGDSANILFYIIGFVSVAQSGFALWYRSQRLSGRLVAGSESFETDLSEGLLIALRPIFLIVAAISVYGFIYFFLTGRFEETLFLVIFSFVVFQVVRPRMSLVEKVVRHQVELLADGSATS